MTLRSVAHLRPKQHVSLLTPACAVRGICLEELCLKMGHLLSCLVDSYSLGLFVDREPLIVPWCTPGPASLKAT